MVPSPSAVDTAIETGFADVDGARLYFETAGAGSPVVLVHGGLWDSRMWDDQFDVFAERHRAIRYDIRGYGRSDRPDGPYSDAQDLSDLLRFVGEKRTSVVGLSMGGGIAIDFALEYPEMVGALVLVASGVGGYESTSDLERLYEPAVEAFEAGDIARAAELELDIWAPLRTDPDVDGRIREIALENSHQLLLDGSLRRRPDPPAISRLVEIGVPTLVTTGDADVRDMDLIAEALVTGINGARRVVVNGADHVINMRKPEEFNRLVLDFLASALL